MAHATITTQDLLLAIRALESMLAHVDETITLAGQHLADDAPTSIAVGGSLYDLRANTEQTLERLHEVYASATGQRTDGAGR